MTLLPDDLGFVGARRLVDGPADMVFGLGPGHRPLIMAGESVVAGAPIAERLRDPQLRDVADGAVQEPVPGGRVTAGELLFGWKGRWRVAGGELTEPLETPIAGIVRSVRPGSSIVIQATGRRLAGIVALGGPTRGKLHVAASSDGEVRAGGLDVGLAGTILVVGSRIDAETLTRARAMGIRGIVVAGLASKERRDFLASELRQRAALHRLPPYAVLVLDGAVRRPLSSPVMAVLRALAGHDVAIVDDPPGLLFDAPDLVLPAAPPDFVRIRGGDLAGREGQWAGLVGLRRFGGGIHLEAGSVRLADGSVVAVPIGDLERFI
jgi:antitoxin (DNA-binding transcriptional repressor) of toxin-antitoxin stability system